MSNSSPGKSGKPIAGSNTLAGATALLRQLEWKAHHPVENILIGDYRSIFRGRGMEFDQVVRYEFGDDIRDIDWNVTARLGEPYRKKFIEERELMLVILFEDSLSLQFGSGGRTKRDALLELVGLIMLLAALNRDRVAVIHSKPGGHTFYEPMRGKGEILHASAKLIGQPAPALTDSRPIGTPWRFISYAAPRHSVFLWLGDFAPAPQPDAWAITRQRYQPVGFRAEDLWERRLPEGPSITAYDPTHQRLVVLDPKSRVHRAAQENWVADRNAKFAKLFPDALSRLVVTPDESMTDALVRFFHGHMRLRTR